MSTLDSAAVWSATSLAFDEKKIGAAGLSVRHRKLLTLLSQPASLPQLAQSIALPIEDVHAALERFARLGFVRSSEEVPLSPMQTQLRSPSAVEAPSRMPLMIGVAVAAMAAVGAAAWLLRGGSPSATSAPVATAAKAQTPTATGPSDTADNGLYGPAARIAVAPVPVPAIAAANAGANAAAAAPGRPVVTPPNAAAAVVAPPTKTAATPTIAPAVANTTIAPTVVAPTTPALPLATVLPAVPAAQPAATPVVVAPAIAAPGTQVATAPTTSAPVAAARPAATVAREIKLVNRVEPTFPRGFDTDKGTVRARLQVDAKGGVTGVDIVEANPPRVFDRTVRTALQQWRYEPTGEAFSVIAEINFTR